MIIEQIQARIVEIQDQLKGRGLTEWEQDDLLVELDGLIELLEAHINKTLQDEQIN